MPLVALINSKSASSVVFDSEKTFKYTDILGNIKIKSSFANGRGEANPVF